MRSAEKEGPRKDELYVTPEFCNEVVERPRVDFPLSYE